MTVLADAGGAGSVFALAAAVQVTLESAVTKGDLIGYGTTGWVRADADLAAGPIVPELIALQSGAALGIIKASRMAQVGERYTINTGTVVALPLYLSGTPGAVTETIPATVGDFRGKVGKILVAGTATVKPVVMLEVPVAMPVHRFFVTAEILSTSVDAHIFTAIRPCIVRAVSAICSVAGEASSVVDVKKIDAVEAPASGVTMLSATLALDTTANTVIVGGLAAVAARTLAAGNGIALDHTGTITSLVGRVTIELEYVE